MDTRQKILNVACEEFLTLGYKGAWLRDIAKKAGVTTGALYGYFKNKEDLFSALVEEAYAGIQTMYATILSDFATLPTSEQASDMLELSTQGMFRLADFMYAHHSAFALIFRCKEETKYGDLVERMARLDEKATSDFSQASSCKLSPIPASLEHILTTGLFTMFFQLIVQDIPQAESQDYIRSLMKFYTSGYSSLMGF